MKRREAQEKQTGKKARGKVPTPAQAGPTNKDPVNFTDEASRIVPFSAGFVPADNAQAAVDIDTPLIVESHMTQAPKDNPQIEATLAGVKAVEGILGKSDNLLADTGYFSEANVKHCAAEDVTPYIPNQRERHPPPLRNDSSPFPLVQRRQIR